MFLLVSVARVRQALKLDDGESDDLIAVYISAASRLVVKHLGGQASAVIQIDSPPNSPPDDLSGVDERVTMAVILLVGHFYRNPDGDPDKDFEDGYLPRPVRAALGQLRDPVMA